MKRPRRLRLAPLDAGPTILDPGRAVSVTVRVEGLPPAHVYATADYRRAHLAAAWGEHCAATATGGTGLHRLISGLIEHAPWASVEVGGICHDLPPPGDARWRELLRIFPI